MFHAFGFSTSEALRLFLDQVKMTHSLPFATREPTEETLEALKEGENYKKLKGYKSYKDFVKEMKREAF